MTDGEPTTAIILAGGLGTRLRSVVADVPKPMAPIDGRPFLEYQLDYWIDQGIRSFILSVGYRYEVIIDHFGANYHGAMLQYAVEEQPLGTGGGLLMAATLAPPHSTLLVLNGDTFFDVSLSELIAFHRQRKSDWTFALFNTCDANRYMGVITDDDCRIVSLRSAMSDKKPFLGNGGVYIIQSDVLADCGYAQGEKVSLEEGILSTIQNAGRALYGLACPGKFIDIGVPHDYHRASEFLRT
ncbi:D-glycero-D-manno-heptose 1-phosphate guanosyltransferase [Paludibacterium sp. THUN1379]|nr:D-glycero-D-manno-heptose 1-phosphate guanosyltransferase [Paludibacterium sp. THUN1379]